MAKSAPLTVKVEDGELRISIGVDTLAFAASLNDELIQYDQTDGEFHEPTIADSKAFAEEVANELETDYFDGPTPVEAMLDRAFVAVAESGSETITLYGDNP